MDQSLLTKVRVISTSVFRNINDSAEITLALMEFSQFLGHDLSHTPYNLSEVCCPDDPTEPISSKCLPIDLTGDDYFSKFNRTCMNFVRSYLASGPDEECKSEYAEQINNKTHWIDGSMIYGSYPDEQQSLRSFKDGFLNTSSNNMPPLMTNQSYSACQGIDSKCFLTGDVRVNQQPGLAAMHILWLREHNRIASTLRSIHSQWDDERLFQETRRIVVAALQHIAYYEFLPLIIGHQKMMEFGMDIGAYGFRSDYSETINPNIITEFSTGAFRFGHSIIQGNLFLISEEGTVSTERIRDHINSDHLIQEGHLDDLLRGFIQIPSKNVDTFFAEDMTEHLFENHVEGNGFDIVSVNIKRGRDHGISTYNSVRAAYGLVPVKEFTDLMNEGYRPEVTMLQEVYKHVDDIDLYVGGLLETAVEGGLVGPTFAYLIADQFARLMKGDRFFYNLQGQPGSFTYDQLKEIRRSSFARIICDNSGVSAVQPNAFLLSSHKDNFPVSCGSSSIPSMDLTVF